MDSFKLDHFRREHPGVSPPTIEALSNAEAHRLRDRIAGKAGLPSGSSPVELTQWISENATAVPQADARSKQFNLQRLLGELGVRATPMVYVNWYRFDRVDRIALIDLTRYFSDIWYPDSDDIEILDDSCAWIVVVAHTGDLRLAILDVA